MENKGQGRIYFGEDLGARDEFRLRNRTPHEQKSNGIWSSDLTRPLLTSRDLAVMPASRPPRHAGFTTSPSRRLHDLAGLFRTSPEFGFPSYVQASIAANTWVVSGTPQSKNFFLNPQCPPNSYHSPDNLENLKKLAEQFQKQGPTAGESVPQAIDDDDEVPELVAGETFEAAAEESDTQKAS
ncbi:nascent polypeptide-associated complex subunit beta [Striga asiatica]|uniref:Nascent polypeptide-associated complex subunit beta n=1 Tax=Striga asiatica TaxID=4170 RepID=A0A5A7PYW3_STRAF|nr:nascent polypeptide-associated complex subunit beta [Striga asiatica]